LSKHRSYFRAVRTNDKTCSEVLVLHSNSGLLQQTHFDSRADLETTLLNYLKLYNHHIPQRAIETKTPIQALKEWQQQ
jgi:hypothetical protein